jgi:zinc protease
MCWLGSLFLVLISAVTLQAQPALSDKSTPVSFNPAVVRGTLPNGLKYFILKNARPADRIEMVLAVNAGAILEDDDQNGLAHFCEHMAFNGTKTFPKQELVKFLESTGVRFGADLNAYTNQDETVYTLTIPANTPNAIAKGFEVLRDWARFVNYDDDDINEERGIIIEELRLRKNAQGRIRDKHRNVLYHGSKYALRDVIGDTNVLLRCPTDNLRRFYRNWYRPENMAIIVVGDRDPEVLEPYIKKHFNFSADPSGVAAKRPSMPLPIHKETLVSIATDKELTRASAEIYWKRPARSTATIAAFRANIVDQVVDLMMVARLGELTRKPNPPYAGAVAGNSGLTRETGIYFASATAAGKDVMAGLRAVYTELQRAAKHGFTATELERAKAEVMANMEQYYNERDKTESGPLASELVRHFLTGEGVPGIEAEYQIYQDVVGSLTVQDVSAVIANAIRNEGRVVTMAIPADAGYAIPKEADVVRLFADVEAITLEPYVDADVASALLDVLPPAGTITKREALADIDATRLTLSNGIVVYTKKTDFKNDEVLISASSWGGTNYHPTEDLFTASLAAGIVDEGGIANVDANMLQKMLAGKQVGISPYISDDAEGFSGQSTPKDMQVFFELLHLYYTQPRKDKDAFTSLVQRTRTSLENRGKNPDIVFGDSVRAFMSNYHPRSRSMSVKDLDAIRLDKAFEIYKQRFANPGDFTFYIVGAFDNDALEQHLCQYLASLPTQSSRETYKDNGMRTRKGEAELTIRKGVEAKSTVARTYSGSMTYNTDERYAISALCEVLSIKLREKLREEKSGVYFVSVNPSFQKLPEPQYAITVYFGCNPDRVAELLDDVRAEIEALQSKAVDNTYIAKVKEIQTKEREVALKTNRFWLNTVRALTRDEEPFSVANRRPELIAALTAEQVMASAKKFLATKNVATLVLKPETK